MGANTGLMIRLFGVAVGLEVDGVPVRPLRSRKGEWLLALLAVQYGREVNREWLAERLWPEADLEAALRSLRQSVWDLRRALGDQGHRIAAPCRRTLRLDVAGADVDIVTFDRLIAQGDPASLEQAVTLYRGGFLETCEEIWAFAERRQRRQAFLNALETLADHAQRVHDHRTAVALRRRSVDEDPDSDDLWRGLMRVLTDAGDPAGAAQAYHDFRHALRRSDSQRRPTAQTVRLYEQVRRLLRKSRQSTSFSAAVPQGRAGGTDALPPGRRPAMPRPPCEVVGRGEELTDVTALVCQHRLVTLTGAGGVGKSCLALAAGERLAAEFPAGAALVDFKLALDTAECMPLVAHTLGLSRRDKPTEMFKVIEALRLRRMLLMLENCERHHEPACRLADAVFNHCPDVHILASSRVPLGLRDERVYLVRLPAWDDVQKRISDHTFDVNGALDSNGNTLLLDATYWGHEDAVRFLLETGADINQAHRSGFTPLLNVIKFGHPHLVPLLLEAGAMVNVRTARGETPLGIAAETGLRETVCELLAAGADPAMTDFRRRTPAALAAGAGHAGLASLLTAEERDEKRRPH